MQNKKTIMAFSAIMILIFHLWVNITHSEIEMFLRRLCVIGVDLFFFVCSYSLGKRKKLDYKSFIKNRFHKIYLKYVIFSIIGAIYLNWDIKRLIKVILGLELFAKGGGAFLWFLPGIMLVYLILPLYKKVDTKYPKITPILTILIFLILSVLASLYSNYKELFILTNRIPIILLGYYFARYHVLEYLNKSKVRYWITTIITLVIGITISYFSYFKHIRVEWFKDLFYILYIPLNIGIAFLLDKIKTNNISNLIGTSTLELYAIQMIFGFKIANMILKNTDQLLLSNILTITILIIIAVVIQYLFNFIEIKFKRNRSLS